MLALVTAVGLLPALLSGARSAAADPALSTATVSSPDGLNLRSGPGTSYSVVAVMPGGAVVTVTGSATADNWLPVQYQGQAGWADGAYLTLTPATTAPASTAPAPPPTPPAAAPAAGPQQATVQPSDGLNLRNAPSTGAAVVAVLPGGATVTVTGAPMGTWVPVSYNGLSGWVDGSYLTSPAPTITSASSASSGGATVGSPGGAAPASALASTTTDTFTTSFTHAPAEAGLPTTSAPPGSAGRFAWPVDSRRITTTFKSSHQAIDIDQFPAGGNPVRATMDGTVIFAGGDACCSYGLYVMIQHPGGFVSLYAHLSRIEVSVGQSLRQGQELGLSGSTGNSTGAHVHFAIYYHDMPLDPLSVLPNDGVQIWAGA